MYKINLLCLCVFTAHICEAYKILVVFPFPSKSHSILGDGVVRHLLNDGNEITYITTFPKVLKPHSNLREINLSSQRALLSEDVLNIEKVMKKEIHVQGLAPLLDIFMKIQVNFLEHEAVQKLFNDPTEQFDVVIVEWMFLELTSGISAVFNCPYILLSTVDPHWMVLRLIDEVTNPAYNADAQSTNVIPFTFIQRASELMNMAFILGLQYFYVSGIENREYERLLAPIIRKRGLKVPDFEEVRYNVSLILGNSHVSMGQPTRLPQNYKAVGGYHIDANTSPLPENIKKVLDNSKDGLIYFSMGSNLRSKFMPSELKASLLKMFGKLKQTIIWKFEEDLPNRPSNVHIMNWAPQQSILAHPNCVIFITHGGLLSTTETIHYGKPIIGIPVFADQFSNVDRSVSRGFAKRVDLSYTMADELEVAIKEILTNPSYSARAKHLSLVYHDRPVPPGQELAHWVQHVARTAGAPHLRSPALMLPWYQKCFLDLAVLIAVILYIVVLGFKKLIGVFSKTQGKKKLQ